MPTYELRCRSCDLPFEKFLMRVLKQEDLLCPSCGSREVSRGVGGGYLSVRGERRLTGPSRDCGTGGFT